MKRTKLSIIRNVGLLGSFLAFALVGMLASEDKNTDGTRQSHDIFTVAHADLVGGGTGGGAVDPSTSATSSASCSSAAGCDSDAGTY